MSQPVVGSPPSSELVDAQVLKPDGTKVRLSDLWAGSPTLLVFLRHFGCMGCDQHVNELSPRLLELHRLGLRTIFAGNGELRCLDGFIERHAFQDKKVKIGTDLSFQAFAAMHLADDPWGGSGGPGQRVTGLSNSMPWVSCRRACQLSRSPLEPALGRKGPSLRGR